jgi:hypothetical protein
MQQRIVTFPTTITSYADIETQPKKIILPMKIHQLATVKKCIELEKKETIETSTFSFTPFFGVIGDCVGSGKSLSILALIALNPKIDRRYFKISNSTVLNGIFEYHEYNQTQTSTDTEYLPCNVLYVPHGIRHQWIQYIETQTKDIRYFMVDSNSTLQEIDDNMVNSMDLLIISSTFSSKFNRNFSRYKFRRVIVDEVDTTNVSGGLPRSLFYWFISSSIQNLYYWDGFTIDLGNNETTHIRGIKPTNTVHRIFRQIHDLKLWNYFLVKNDDRVVHQGLSLPNPIKKRCKCRSLNYTRILKDFLDPSIVQMLNADNIHGALKSLGCNNICKETNLVDVVIENQNRKILDLKREYRYIEEKNYKNQTVKETQLEKINQKIHLIETRIENIKLRITEQGNCCTICYDSPNIKSIVPCCHNTYCFSCISQWVVKHNSCPLCRTHITLKDLIVSSENIQHGDVSLLPTKKDKLIEKVIPDDSRVLVFAMYEETLQQVEETLNERCIPYDFVNGSNKIIQQKIEKFKSGKIRVLLLNSKHYAAGLNLQCATDVILYHGMDSDMEKQCIGRAQRIGRIQPLRVWKFITELET